MYGGKDYVDGRGASLRTNEVSRSCLVNVLLLVDEIAPVADSAKICLGGRE